LTDEDKILSFMSHRAMETYTALLLAFKVEVDMKENDVGL